MASAAVAAAPVTFPLASIALASTQRMSGISRSIPSSRASASAWVPSSMAALRSPSASAIPAAAESRTTRAIRRDPASNGIASAM